MRIIKDKDGTKWQVALLDGSYGHYVLIFSEEHGSTTLQHYFHADNLNEANYRLASIEEAELLTMLTKAEPLKMAKEGPLFHNR